MISTTPTWDGMNDEVHCPVCGYYCLGKGGVGCIDKPKLCGVPLKLGVNKYES